MMGRRGAVVEERDGPGRALMQSTLPLEARDDSGRLAPVSLELVPQPDGDLETENGLVDVEIDASRPMGVLSDEGAGVAFSGGPTGAAMVSNGRAFYVDVQRDTAAVVEPQPLGFEMSLIVLSMDAPESFGLDAAGVSGVTFEEITEDVPEGLAHPFAVRRDGERVGVVMPPVAFDADGRPVRVELVKAGASRLLLSVPHRSADVRYPLVADPEIHSGFGNLGWPGWEFEEHLGQGAGGPYHFACASSNAAGQPCPRTPYWSSGYFVAMPQASAFSNGAYGLWKLRAPAGTGIYQFRAGGVTHSAAYCTSGQVCGRLVAGITTPAEVGWEAGPEMRQYAFGPGSPLQVFCSNPCARNSSGTGEHNYAWFALQMAAPTSFIGQGGDYLTMQYADLWYRDFKIPTFSHLSGSASGSPPPPVALPGWSSSTQRTIYVRVSDVGGGLAGAGSVIFDGGPPQLPADCSNPHRFQCSDVLPDPGQGLHSITYPNPRGHARPSHQGARPVRQRERPALVDRQGRSNGPGAVGAGRSDHHVEHGVRGQRVGCGRGCVVVGGDGDGA